MVFQVVLLNKLLFTVATLVMTDSIMSQEVLLQAPFLCESFLSVKIKLSEFNTLLPHVAKMRRRGHKPFLPHIAKNATVVTSHFYFNIKSV